MDSHSFTSELLSIWYKELSTENAVPLLLIGSTKDNKLILKGGPSVAREQLLLVLEQTATAIREEMQNEKPDPT